LAVKGARLTGIFSIKKEITADDPKMASESEMATGSPANPSAQRLG